MVRLEPVAPGHREAFLEMAREFRSGGDERFAGVLDDWDAYLAHTQAARQGRGLPPNRVQQTSFLAFHGERLIGGARLRHRRIELLERDGGNIGYEVRPSERRNGYGHGILAAALDEARRIGLGSVLLTAETGNLASLRTIERAGGVRAGTSVSHNNFRTMARYHIELGPLTRPTSGP
ncbi:MAG: GNAT family N-acetyltransferase [Myxococcota bacterium]